MFRSARFKLTAWYLLIIMVVSLSFSMVIHTMIMREVRRFSEQQMFWVQRHLEDEPPFNQPGRVVIFKPSNDLVDDVDRRVTVSLICINAIILVFSGGFGYFLAGRTLRPIQVMIDEQTRFISDASHELRTPLTALKTSFEVALRNKSLTIKEAKEVIKEGVDDANILQLLSDNLLQFTQLETQNAINIEPVELSSLIRKAMAQIAPIAKKEKISLNSTLIQTKVMGNDQKLIELFIILLENAVKYNTKEGDIAVNMRHFDGKVEVSIKDTGIGIPKEDLPHIFDRFYRVDISRTKNLKKQVSGYGLGLSIAKRTVQIHNGSIFATSEVGKGATFSIILPRLATGVLQK